MALAIYLAVWVSTVARPMAYHASRAQLGQGSPDPNFYVWSLRWWPYAIGRGLNPMYSSEIAAPAGHTLAWATTAPPLALLASPLTVISGPVVSFNLLAALALPLSAWAAFVLCRRLTGRFWAALVGGAVFGFSAFETSHDVFGQLNVTYCLLLPILAYLVLLWREAAIRSRTFVILAAIMLVVQSYLFLETFADLTAVLAVSFVLGIALAGRAGRPEILRLAKITALACVIALVLAAPYIGYALVNTPPRPARITAMDLASLVIPQPRRTFGMAWLAHTAAGPDRISVACYVGVPLLLLAVLLAVTGWSSKLVRFLSCMLAIIIVTSLGPVVYLEGRQVAALPWARLFDLPVVRNAWPSRLMLFAFLALAVATALWLAGPAGRLSWLRWPLAVLVLAAVALDVSPTPVTRHTTVPPLISSGQYRRDISPGEIVVVVSNVRNAGMLWQAESDFYMRLAGGFINAGYTHGTDLPAPVQDLAHASPSIVTSFESYVRRDQVGAVLLDGAHEPGWAGIFSRLGLVGRRVGDVVVYQTNDCKSCHALDWAQIGKRSPETA